MKRRITILMLAGIMMLNQNGMIVMAESSDSQQSMLHIQEAAQIASIDVSTEHISAKGGQVELQIHGSDLTADNWGVEITTYLDGGMEWTRLSASITEKDAEHATIQIPVNTMRNNMEYCIKVGLLSDGKIMNPLEATIYQSKKSETVTVDPKSVSLGADNSLVVTFGQTIQAKDLNELRKNFYLSDFKSESANRYNLTEDDIITINDHTLTIQLSTSYPITSSSAIHINDGALQNAEGTDIHAIDWLITSSARVNSIVLSDEILDAAGGTITATLKGSKLGTLSAGDIDAKIFVSGTSTATDIPVTITTGNEPALTYTLPANQTKDTQSYYLRVRINGMPVYEATSENPAKAAVVSVMAEGVDKSAQTLSSISVSGNSNSDSDSDVRSLILNAQTTSGGVKMTLRLTGTNLDPSIVKVRAIDENGIIWPVYHIAECDGSWRFLAVAHMYKNGAVGGGNTMLIEVLPAKYAGSDKQYKVQVAIDGKHFLDTPSIDLQVLNAGLKDDTEFRSCGPEDIKNVTVHYVDTETGEALAEQDIYKGYSISMVQGFPIAPKEIAGYELVKSPEIDLENDFVEGGKEYRFEYRKVNEPAVYQNPFSDITKSDDTWYYDSVAYVNEHQLMTGKTPTIFAPFENIPRAQVAVILYRMAGKPEVTYKDIFQDVPQGDWYTDAVIWANQAGIILGYGDSGLFGTNDNITREQLATMLYRYAEHMKYDTSERTDYTAYTDGSLVHDFAKVPMSWAVKAKIITGKDNQTRLDPEGTASRAECATIIERFHRQFAK